VTHHRLANALHRIRQYGLAQRSEYPVSESLRRAHRLVSDRLGIVAKVEFQRMRPDEPKVYWAHASPPLFYQGSQTCLEHHGFGISAIPERAVIKAIGECVERYCAYPTDHSTLEFGSHATVSQTCKAVALGRFALFSQAQYADPALPFEHPACERPMHWVKGVSLTCGDPILVPASFVFVPYDSRITSFPPEPRFATPISTGLACGPTYCAAVYRGLLEVIERDAFMLSWRHEHSMPTLDTREFRGALTQSLLRAVGEIPVSCVAKLATVDISVSVVLVMLTATTPRFPLFAMGAGADFDTEQALVLALEEALLCYTGLCRVESPQDVDERAELARGVNAVALHGLAHARNASLQAMRRCLVEPTAFAANARTARREGTLGDLVQELSEKGYEAIAVDLTPADIDEAGFKVVRVLVPGLQPLDIDQNWPYLGSARSKAMFQRLDGEPVPQANSLPNRMPHPFA
jgi:ribosomal protein S12 methylthiotransferase accessory factor